ncbi:MAG: LysR family transcriptional regulator [Ruminococcaceae bacterium]|nr:LysR family transcriptional regulator [Oscillospiraceae bacterium]
MELTQIRYFLEVAESQHITASAEKLHIAQPALSQVIRRLEEDLGVPLFTKKGRNVVLTSYGKQLQKELRPVIEKLNAIPDIMKTMAKINQETIHLNVLAASALVTEAIIEYKKVHEDINFQLLQNTQTDIFDIEITTEMDYHLQKENQFVCSEKILLAVPNNEKYVGITSVSLRDLREEGFICLLGSRQFRYICDKFCHRAGLFPRVIFESDTPSVVKNMIAANMGVGFWPEFTWGKIDSDKVKLLEIQEECSRKIIMNYNLNKEDNSSVINFFEFLKLHFTQLSDKIY